jgi:hypothetical protein
MYYPLKKKNHIDASPKPNYEAIPPLPPNLPPLHDNNTLGFQTKHSTCEKKEVFRETPIPPLSIPF